MSNTRKLITFDWAIKRLLRSKANFGILEGFLSELLKEEITILDLLESESNKDDKLDKYNRAATVGVFYRRNWQAGPSSLNLGESRSTHPAYLGRCR